MRRERDESFLVAFLAQVVCRICFSILSDFLMLFHGVKSTQRQSYRQSLWAGRSSEKANKCLSRCWSVSVPCWAPTWHSAVVPWSSRNLPSPLPSTNALSGTFSAHCLESGSGPFAKPGNHTHRQWPGSHFTVSGLADIAGTSSQDRVPH